MKHKHKQSTAFKKAKTTKTTTTTTTTITNVVSSFSLPVLFGLINLILLSIQVNQPVASEQILATAKVTNDRDVSLPNLQASLNWLADELTFLENMEDLNHLTYLLLRNYNITDDGLLQSSWLIGLGNALGSHKQHQYASAPTSISDTKSKLALELESFISHLRNGHLRRLSLEDLESLVVAFNLTESLDILLKRYLKTNANVLPMVSEQRHQREGNGQLMVSNVGNDEKRCYHLVVLYKFELGERNSKQQHEITSASNRQQELQSSSEGSRVEYVASVSNFKSNDNGLQKSQNLSASIDSSLVRDNTTNDESNISASKSNQNVQIDEGRLLRLCKLAVSCLSADDMVNLINKPWDKIQSAKGQHSCADMVAEPLELDKETQLQNSRRHSRSYSDGSKIGDEGDEISYEDRNNEIASKWPRKSLRDSFSSSLAKLCPLMLFQLHEDDGQCSVARDDSPPGLAVWGFATLFVTIVSFCSLIGLSITPLIGQSATADDTITGSSSSSSSSSESSSRGALQGPKRVGEHNIDVINQQQQPSHQHKATLTVFEGLAVGSLVGSALFSLIPQAFELQERESNQTFLLKAFIIFSGIYLFFCSERIMRIILDTRQNSKRKKRLNNRSSTTAPAAEPLDSAMVTQVTPSFSDDKKIVPAYAQAGVISLGSQEEFNRLPQRKGSTIVDQCIKNKTNLDTALMSRNGSAKIRTMMRTRGGPSAKSNKSPDLRPRKRRQRKSQQVAGHRKNKRRNPDQNESDLDEYRQLRRTSSSGSMNSNSSMTSYNSTCLRAAREGLITFKSHKHGDILDDYCSISSDFCSDSSLAKSIEGELDRHHNDVWSDSDENQDTRGKSQVNLCVVGNQNPRCGTLNDAPRQNNQILLHMMGSRRGSRRNRLSPSFNELQPQRQKQEISTVAWMIILGDGLHNFIDGISIGAAFSESILSGVSISVAVICEEFPHELGDFAVLVSSGMTVRQALGYNFLSACTCYFGMAIGIILGDVTDCASYISALAAGVFLYIALVDMMGELSATLEESSRDSITRTLKLFFLQNVGIFIGISIIFVLSFMDF